MEEKERLGFLDSIRGIAAFIVVLHHCWLMNTASFRDSYRGLSNAFRSGTQFFYFSVEKFFETGRSAVLIFFVLSGFVLAYSLLKQKISYKAYIVKRIFRIYPAFLVVILASYALHYFFGIRHEVHSELFKAGQSPDLSLIILGKHIMLLGTTGTSKLDDVIWTLVHEVRISIIFPFILFTVYRYRWISILLYWIVSIICTTWCFYVTGDIARGYVTETFPITLLNTGFFLPFFATGAFLAMERQWVALRISLLSRWIKLAMFVFVACCLLKSDYGDQEIKNTIVDYMRCIGALGLIALALGVRKFAQTLSNKILIWLGRISYSLYLVHLPIFYGTTQLIGGRWSVLQTSLVVVPLSLCVADITARLVEYPSIKLGKKISAKLLT